MGRLESNVVLMNHELLQELKFAQKLNLPAGEIFVPAFLFIPKVWLNTVKILSEIILKRKRYQS